MRLTVCCLFAVAALVGPCLRADVIYNVNITTSPLISHPAGPFSLEVQFNDGSGTSDGNNVVTLSAFTFGLGKPVGLPNVIGGATGALGSFVALRDTAFFNQFVQTFDPGGTLSFQLSVTTNLDAGGVPDEFSLAVLDSSGFEIPTLNLDNALIVIDIDSGSPTISTFATNTDQSPHAGGAPIRIGSPSVTLAPSSVPEPRTVLLFTTAVGCAIFWKRRTVTSNFSRLNRWPGPPPVVRHQNPDLARTAL